MQNSQEKKQSKNNFREAYANNACVARSLSFPLGYHTKTAPPDVYCWSNSSEARSTTRDKGQRSTSRPVHRPASRPVHRPASRPAHRPSSHPVHRPSSRPVHRPASRPVHRPASRPVTEPGRDGRQRTNNAIQYYTRKTAHHSASFHK